MSIKSKLIHLLGGYTKDEVSERITCLSECFRAEIAGYLARIEKLEAQLAEYQKSTAVTEIILNKGGKIQMLDAEGNPVPFTYDLGGGTLKEE